MGEAAEDILDGSCCQYCGEWFHDGEPPGHPRSCGCDGAAPASSGRTKKNRRKRERHKRRRADALAAADKKGWSKFTEYHFHRMVGNERLDWWPSTGKYMWRGQVIGAEQARKILK